MALFQTRIALHSYVRIAFGQRMRLHLFLSYKLCLQHNLHRLLWKPQNDWNRMSIFRAKYQGDHQVWDYVGEGPEPDHHQVIAQSKQVNTHLTNSIKNLDVNPKFEPKKHLNKNSQYIQTQTQKTIQSIVKMTEKGTKNFKKEGPIGTKVWQMSPMETVPIKIETANTILQKRRFMSCWSTYATKKTKNKHNDEEELQPITI